MFQGNIGRGMDDFFGHANDLEPLCPSLDLRIKNLREAKMLHLRTLTSHHSNSTLGEYAGEKRLMPPSEYEYSLPLSDLTFRSQRDDTQRPASLGLPDFR
jgi:hypothetical protein